MKDNKVIARSVLIVVVVLVVFCGMAIAESTYAKSAKWRIVHRDGGSVKVGKYYFRYKENWQYTKSKKRGYKDLHKPMDGLYSDAIVTNGKKVYLFCGGENRGKVYSTRIGSGKLKKCKTIGSDSTPTYCYREFVFCEDYSGEYPNLYAYDINTNRYTPILKKCIWDAKGKYLVIGGNVWDGAVYNENQSNADLYRIKGNKMKKIKSLGKLCTEAKFVKNSLYYAQYSSKKLNVVTIYKCSNNGKNLKRVVRFKSDKREGTIYVQKITAKKCVLVGDKYKYHYYFKSERLKRVKLRGEWI